MMLTKTLHHCSLSIREFELPIFLGWPTDERNSLQTISMDIDIKLPEPPLACETDNLEDTLCYSWLIDQLKKQLEHQTFRLIEHLAAVVYSILKKLSPDHSLIKVKINKKPHILGLKGGTTFCYGDHFIS